MQSSLNAIRCSSHFSYRAVNNTATFRYCTSVASLLHSGMVKFLWTQQHSMLWLHTNRQIICGQCASRVSQGLYSHWKSIYILPAAVPPIDLYKSDSRHWQLMDVQAAFTTTGKDILILYSSCPWPHIFSCLKVVVNFVLPLVPTGQLYNKAYLWALWISPKLPQLRRYSACMQPMTSLVHALWRAYSARLSESVLEMAPPMHPQE